MEFLPSFCPFEGCQSHADLAGFRFRRAGSYRRACDQRHVERFVCRACQRRFSSQTFRLDYRFRKPQVDGWILRCFVSKVTHRQTARILKINRKTVQRRLLRFGPALLDFHREHLDRALRSGGIRGSFSLDELETFEGSRRLCPVTVPVLIDRRTFFVVWSETAQMAARGRLGAREQAKKLERERLHGVRRSGAREAISACLDALRKVHAPGLVEVITDQKGVYRAEIRRRFQGRIGAHVTESSKRARNRSNPLFAINHTFAMLRDQVSRLVRRSWGASKKREALRIHLWIWTAWRNYCRPITNEAPATTPAMALLVARRQYSITELLRWRWPSRMILRQPKGPVS
jgi:transposase-like protein